MDHLNEKITVARNAGRNVLTINRVSTADAGAYSCIDEDDTGEVTSAELVVLGICI